MVYCENMNAVRIWRLSIPTNRLQKAVFMDAKEDILISGCKVLGLISKLTTAPLWRILEGGMHHSSR